MRCQEGKLDLEVCYELRRGWGPAMKIRKLKDSREQGKGAGYRKTKGGRQCCPGGRGGSLCDAVGVKARSSSLGKAFSLLTQVSIFILCPCSVKGERRNNLPDLWVPLLQFQDSPGWSLPLTQEHTGVQGDWQSWKRSSENRDSWATVP